MNYIYIKLINFSYNPAIPKKKIKKIKTWIRWK